jgi:HD superfamily phosphodiesterase
MRKLAVAILLMLALTLHEHQLFSLLVTLQDTDVIGALEGGWIHDIALAQASTDAIEGFEIARG